MDELTTGGTTRVGLVVATPRHERAAGLLADWLVTTAAATCPDVVVDALDLAGPPDPADPARPVVGPDGTIRDLPERDGYVLLVPQYGPVPAPAVEDAVAAHAARWAGRPVGLVAYGGVSRGRDAATRIRGALAEVGGAVPEVVLGINVAQVRREGGPGPFEQLGWQMLLDGLARGVEVRTATG